MDIVFPVRRWLKVEGQQTVCDHNQPKQAASEQRVHEQVSARWLVLV